MVFAAVSCLVISLYGCSQGDPAPDGGSAKPGMINSYEKAKSQIMDIDKIQRERYPVK
jgi:hypothetical protein